MCTTCGNQFRLPLSCGCDNLCQSCILRLIACTTRSKALWGDEIRACFRPWHSISVPEALDIAKGSGLEAGLLEVLPTATHLPATSTCPHHCEGVDSSQQSPVEYEADPSLLPLLGRCVHLYRNYAGNHSLYSEVMKAWTLPCPLCQVYIEGGENVSLGTVCPQCSYPYCSQCGESLHSGGHLNHSTREGLQTYLYILLSVLTLLKIWSVNHHLEAPLGAGLSILTNLVYLLLGSGVVIAYDTFEVLQGNSINGAIELALLLGVCALGLGGSALYFGVWSVVKGPAMLVLAALHCTLLFGYRKHY